MGKVYEEMKKLFVLIFTLTLSTNAFSWGGGVFCDKFLDWRKSNANSELFNADTAAFTFYVIGLRDIWGTTNKQLSGYLEQFLMNPTVTANQRLYLIEKGCREQPTNELFVVAHAVYQKIVEEFLAKKVLEEN